MRSVTPNANVPNARPEYETGVSDTAPSSQPSAVDTRPDTPLHKSAHRSNLSQQADRVLKDIDRQMQSLPADEAQQLKTQFAALLDASTCIIDREQFDPANLRPAERKRLADTAQTLRQQVPVTDIAGKKKRFRSAQPCVSAYSKHLAASIETDWRGITFDFARGRSR